MYEELIRALREHADKKCVAFKGAHACGSNLALEAADAIEELSHEIDIDNAAMTAMDAAMPRWIHVTERLPKYGDWVLGIGPKKGYHVCEYRGITHFPYSGDIPWFSAKGRSLNITHWMPLPEPPEDET